MLERKRVCRRRMPAFMSGVKAATMSLSSHLRDPATPAGRKTTREGVKVSMNPGGDLDYGMIGAAGTLRAEPGLWVNVTKVAGIQTDLIINELLRGTSAHEEMPANTLIIANSYLDIIEGQESEPHSSLWIEIERDPDCLVCGERLKLGVSVCWRRPMARTSRSKILAASGLTTDILFEDEED